MKTFLLGLFGLAVIGASALMGPAPVFGGEAGCCPEPTCCPAPQANCQLVHQGCCPEAGCEAGCGGCNCCNSRCEFCPHCGCKLEPVCHPTCETKKETVHKYCCTCKDVCIPHVTPMCQAGCNECESGACPGGCQSGCAGGCASGCDPSNQGCGDCCRVRTVHKLVVCPVVKEHSVRACKVTWVCPKCGDCCGGCEAAPASNMPPAAPGLAPLAPAPAPVIKSFPPASKTTEVAPLPQDVSMSPAGF
jgi:hypothetical protein